MLTIKSVEAIALQALFEDIYGGVDRVPEHLLVPAASHVVYPRYGQFTTLVKITAQDGTVGYGEGYGLPNALFPAMIIRDMMADMLVGKDAMQTARIYNDLMSLPLRGGHSRGFVMSAISGIDQALWDLKAKHLGVPVHTLLGGKIHDRIICYASPIMFYDDPNDTAKKAQEYIARGFRWIKLKVGRGIDVDIPHIAAARGVMAPDMKLLLDVNSAYDAQTAILFAKEAEPYGIYWMEEPVPTENADAYRYIRSRVNMYVATGESDCSLSAFRDLIVREGVDVIMPNLARAGGITGTQEIAHLAKAFSVKLSPHGVGSGINLHAAIAVMAANENALVYEYNQLLNPLREEIGGTGVLFRDGRITVSDGPGLGFTLTEAAIEKYRTDSSRQHRPAERARQKEAL